MSSSIVVVGVGSSAHVRGSASSEPSRRHRSISAAIASSTKRNEFRFLSSVRVPSAASPRGRIETLASQRNWPFSMSASLTSR